VTKRSGDKRRTAPTLAIISIAAALTGCSPAPATAPTSERVDVTAVIDGDTIQVATASARERVRLIGIDTPEIGRNGQPGECYAEQAREFLDELVYGKTVELVGDPTQGDVDTYGRLLRHVLIDGQSASLAALSAGAGREYTYDTDYTDQQAHRNAEIAAKAAGNGMWSACP
jgi:micrococcal nuclease